MEDSPTWASTLGDRRWNDRWEDVSVEAIRRSYDHEIEVLGRLKAIDRGRLPVRDQVNYDLLK